MHTCPDCGIDCYCQGDIDDIYFGDWDDCVHYRGRNCLDIDEYEDYE